jgi:hypothetical protein
MDETADPRTFEEPGTVSGPPVVTWSAGPAEVTSPHTVAEPAGYLNRLNAAGFCRQCLTRGCIASRCVNQWRGLVWAECTTCHGSGSADYALALANGSPDLATTDCDHCTDGVLEQHVDDGTGTGHDQHQRPHPDSQI